MMMKEYKLYKDLIITGPLSTIILQFLSDMRFSGRKYRSEECYLKSIDETAKEMNCSENDLSQELVEKWIQKNDFESHKTWSNRIVIIRRLAKYMNARGYNAYTTPIIVSKKSTDFVPYIFTKKELQRLFDAADHLPSYANCPNRTIVFSLLIRLLYGCGLRISEALHLKMKDVDLKNGVLCIRQSKFEKSRYVPMDLNLTERCKKYVQLIRNNATAEDFFLPSPDNGPYSHRAVHKSFRQCLFNANIPYNGKGPRIHDLRHTFAVTCLKNWVIAGNDIDSMLPVLSAYLGHKSMSGTQHYLRLTSEMFPQITESVEKKFGPIISGGLS